MKDTFARGEIEKLQEQLRLAQHDIARLTEQLTYDVYTDSILFRGSIACGKSTLRAADVKANLDEHDNKFSELYEFLGLQRVNHPSKTVLEKKPSTTPKS